MALARGVRGGGDGGGGDGDCVPQTDCIQFKPSVIPGGLYVPDA